jgi:C4-dicarboxylate-specific signal transduction histidine kinase
MTLRAAIIFLSAACSWYAAPALSDASPSQVNEVRIGVLAFRGAEKAHQRWDRLADYLTRQVMGHRFSIETFDLNGMDEAVRNQRIDFVLTNPGNYVRLESLFGATRITTLSNLHQGKSYTVYAAVILTRSDNREIRQLSDLAGHSFMAVSKDAFGGFQMAWYELYQQGINPFRDFRRLEFNGFPQDKIIMAVRDGKVDAGTVRAETFSRMVEENRIRAADFTVLNAKTDKNYPFPHSTRLYPEWAFARLNHTDEKLAQRVAVALLTFSDNTAGEKLPTTGWTIPLDYSRVHETFRVLKIGPYANTGKITLKGIWTQYSAWIIAGLLFVFVIMMITAYVLRINRRLTSSQIELQDQIKVRKRAESKLAQHTDRLEEMVSERTHELEALNLELENDIQVRKTVEEILRTSDAALRKLYEITSGTGVSFDSKVNSLLKFGCDYFQMPRAQLLKLAESQYNIIRSYPENPDSQPTSDEYDFCFGVTITVRENIYGAICFLGKASAPPALSSVDQDILQLIAQWLGGEIGRMDIEEKAREHRSQLAHVSRLGTMGELASGLAHELNQPLTAIANFTRGCIRRLQKDDPDLPAILSAMDYSVREAERAAQIIKRLRNFVAKGEVSRSLTSINDSIRMVLELSDNEINRFEITIDLQLEEDLPDILADRIQIEQVVLNLLRNSIESLQSIELPRVISIHTSDGDHTITVTLKDNGPGISNENRQNLFHPFFTTKKQGMGLGLSISRSIIEAHGGQLSIMDTDDGCAFHFTLPINENTNGSRS